ncbi:MULTISPECIES: DUF4339 domain-containing protein [unclassified Bradyrhizobium]
MADRSWFYASEGQQKGPFPEFQLRDLIMRGTVGPDTLVWTEGMAGWQKAREIPGLISDPSSSAMPSQAGGPPIVTAAGYAGGTVSADLPIWELFGRSLWFAIGQLLVIPAPWSATGFYRWIIPHINVPGRPNLGFTGQVGDIWYVFVAIGLLSYTGWTESTTVELLAPLLQAALGWVVIRWIASHLTSNGQQLPIAFNGSIIAYTGWYLLLAISFITIIGWAWVTTAWMRWMCRNIEGTRREIIFKASGLEMLWRTVLFTIGCLLLIPIPWALRWYANWYLSQFALVERSTLANA